MNSSTWQHERPVARRGRLRALRSSSSGARLVWGAVAVTAVAVLWSVVAFGIAVQSGAATRAALEQAAVDGLPPGLPVVARGIAGDTAAAGYASAVSPRPVSQVLAGLQPRGGSRWQPVPGTTTPTSRAWISASLRFLLTVDARPCSAVGAPPGCPVGGSVVDVHVAPGGPRS